MGVLDGVNETGSGKQYVNQKAPSNADYIQ